jgi:hypothetical protein
MSNNSLFGLNRRRVGYVDDEWAVWVLGLDDIHAKDNLADALEMANELNATFAELRMRDSSEFTPVLYAVVLHRGYAWTRATEHAHKLDCGHPDCGSCSSSRATPIRCSRCRGEDGPFTDEQLCEACARPMPLDGVA